MIPNPHPCHAGCDDDPILKLPHLFNLKLFSVWEELLLSKALGRLELLHEWLGIWHKKEGRVRCSRCPSGVWMVSCVVGDGEREEMSRVHRSCLLLQR